MILGGCRQARQGSCRGQFGQFGSGWLVGWTRRDVRVLQDGGACASRRGRQGSLLASAGKAEIDSVPSLPASALVFALQDSAEHEHLLAQPPSDPAEARQPAATPSSLWGVRLLELCTRVLNMPQRKRMVWSNQVAWKRPPSLFGPCFSSPSITDLVRDRRLGSCQNQ